MKKIIILLVVSLLLVGNVSAFNLANWFADLFRFPLYMGSAICQSYDNAQTTADYIIKSKGYCSDVCYPYRYDYCIDTYGESKGYYVKCFVDRPIDEWYCKEPTPPADECTYDDDCDYNEKCTKTSLGNRKCATFSCPSGYEIQNHNCVPITQECTNECSYSGQTKCSGTRTYQMCGNYDSDKCLEWSSNINCATLDTVCEDGKCILKCTQGFMGDKICSIDFTSVTQTFRYSDCRQETRVIEICSYQCQNGVCIEERPLQEICDNNIDDDNDGLIDCDDFDCVGVGDCGQPPCINGEKLTKLCPDGSPIITAECVNGNWIPTKNICEEAKFPWIKIIVIVLIVVGVVWFIIRKSKKKR